MDPEQVERMRAVGVDVGEGGGDLGREGGGIGEWDLRVARHAVAAVLRRRPEAYHQTLRDHEAGAAAVTEAGDGLICDACKLKYPIQDDIPVMLIDEGDKWISTAEDQLPIPPPEK